MELITILNRCHHFRGFVYHQARFSTDRKSIEVQVRSRKWQREQTAVEPLRGRTATSMLFLSVLKWAC